MTAQAFESARPESGSWSCLLLTVQLGADVSALLRLGDENTHRTGW